MDPYRKTKGGVLIPRGFSNTYEAVRYSRKRRWMPLVSKDSRDILTPSVLRVLRSHARQLYARSGLVRGAFRDVARYLIGHDGIRPQSMCSDTGWAREIEARWQNWLKIADIRRALHLNQIIRASSVEMDTDGDFGLILTETGGGNEAPGMAQIQTVRAHRIEDAGSDNKSAAGVILDKRGRVLFYRVTEGEGKFRDIPAQSFIMLGDPELSDWVRYPSAIAHGINVVVDGREIMDSVTTGIKTRASKAMVIKTPTGEADPDEYDTPEGEEDPELPNLTLEEIQSGEIMRLGPGEEIQDMSQDFPGQHVMPIMEFQYREFAIGYGTPLEFVYKSDLGGPAQRFFLSKFQRRVDERRAQVYIPHLYFRLYGFFAAQEMKRGAMPFREDWWKVRFVPTSPKVTIDVGKEAKENREDILFGSRTLEEDAGERGLDWEELRDQGEREADDLITRAKRLAEKHNIDLALALSLLSRRTPNGNLPVDAPQSSPTPPSE